MFCFLVVGIVGLGEQSFGNAVYSKSYCRDPEAWKQPTKSFSPREDALISPCFAVMTVSF